MAGFEGKYSDEDILEQLRYHYKKNSEITRSSFAKDKAVCSSSIVYMRFGSWNNALLKAGIGNKITKEKIMIKEKELNDDLETIKIGRDRKSVV